ncbi:MAG: SMI1/KNR4 family protein [Victivallaceae bacterium]|nr:SMI1/KNR4 family protein [Victivallaceae bacterium]
MSAFKESIEKNIAGVEFSKFPASASTLQVVQQELGCILGTQLKCYLLEFGYLARGSNEMYGVNEHQKLDSDLVKTTAILHADFPVSRGKFVVDNQGDGDYILCDSQDMIYEFIPSDKNELIPLGQTLLEYIMTRLQE